MKGEMKVEQNKDKRGENGTFEAIEYFKQILKHQMKN